MSDSVDRVFSHALNTVNKIRTGSQKPPSATRLRLYGLYKQAMEGNVDGVMERPQGKSEEQQRMREKWDAWKQQSRLSRTEAKRRYIVTLIDTMHEYASSSPDSRELVAELEFVWDQVKSNVPSSRSSSPRGVFSQEGMSATSIYASHLAQSGRAAMTEATEDEALQPKSPKSYSKTLLKEEEDEAGADQEEFVDAQDSQYNPVSEDAGVQTDFPDLVHQKPVPIDTSILVPRISSVPPHSTPILPFSRGRAAEGGKETWTDQKWRKRVDQALVQITAEVAALREQLEARHLFSHSRPYRLFRRTWRFLWSVVKHIAIDGLILALVLLWVRRKNNKRVEGAVKVLLGTGVAQMQKASKVKLPSLVHKKRS